MCLTYTSSLVENYTPQEELKSRYNFTWTSSSIKYLGVYLPEDTPTLYCLKYDHINKKIYDDLDRWNSLPLDLSGRIETIKMNILPRLLYLFQSLPIEIPPKQFREWDKRISRFIWNRKRPRTRYTTLQLPKNCGGMALPNLKDYYVSAQLRPLLCWYNSEYESKWKDIGTTLTEIPIQSVLGNEDVVK